MKVGEPMEDSCPESLEQRSCSNANALAAVRDDTPSLAKMFCRCRRTVCSADHEGRGDLPVALAGGDQAQHLELPLRQPMGSAGSGVATKRVEPGEVRRRSQLLEHAAGRLHLEGGSVLVPQHAAGQPGQRAQARELVWGIELLPRTAGPPQSDQGGAGLAFRQGHRSAGPAGQGQP
jgi:hypothetical protein